jgi:hypothetical protein
MSKSPRCTCGHALSSHRQDPDDVWANEKCKTCRCASFDDGRKTVMWDDDGHPEAQEAVRGRS